MEEEEEGGYCYLLGVMTTKKLFLVLLCDMTLPCRPEKKNEKTMFFFEGESHMGDPVVGNRGRKMHEFLIIIHISIVH